MLRRTRVTLCTVLVLTLVVSALSTGTIAQDSATPSSTGANQLLQADGVDAPILFRTPFDSQTLEQPRFVLQRLELGAGASLPQHTAVTTEMLFIEEGTVSIADNFGFTSVATSGDALTLVPGSAYSLANDSTDPVSVFRASLALGTDEEVGTIEAGINPDAMATPGASPVSEASTADPSQTSPAGTVTSLIDLPVDAVPSGDATFFVSKLTVSPGAETGERNHSGPISLYIDQGTLAVQSPSGLPSQLQQGQAVALPETAALIATNPGSEPAVVFLLGVVATADVLMPEVTPAPLPTPTSEPTSEPTATTAPTPTVEPTATSEPTSTPEPTAIPSPTPRPVTESGTVLQLGQVWYTGDATLTVAMVREPGIGNSSGNFVLGFTYRNLSSERVDFAPATASIRVYDDQRSSWEFGGGANDLEELTNSRIILQPDESITHEFRFYSPAGPDYTANVFVVVEDFGEIDRAKWGLTFVNNRILTIPPDAVDPTESGGSSVPDGDTSETTIQSAPSRNVTSMESLMPPETSVTSGLVMLEEGGYAAEEITIWFIDPNEAANLFQQWGWQQNIFRTFVPASGETLDNGLMRLEVSAHRFGGPDSAAAALDYICEVRRIQLGMVDGSVELLGDQSRAIGGQTPEGVEVSVYVRRGDVVIRVTAIAAWGDPTAEAVNAARWVATA